MREPAERIEAFIVEWLERELVPAPPVIDPSRPLIELGLDSIDAAQLIGDLEIQFACTISPTLIFEHPTIARFSTQLAKELPRTRVGRLGAVDG